MRILIVEDDTALTQLLQLVFESRGLRVTVAETGKQALEAVVKEPPAVVLLDLMMPDVDGLEICRGIRANPHTADIPIIVLTAKTSEESRQELLEAGATDYLVKPVRPSDLIKRIRAIAADRTPAALTTLT
jgi:DNA-binding response OmpR family regulator